MKGFGAFESVYDISDILTTNVETTSLVVPTQFMVPVIGHKDQKQQPDCTAEVVAKMMEMMYGIPFSAQFIYNVGKVYFDGNWERGSSIRTMLKVVSKYGALPLALNKKDNPNVSYLEYTAVWFSDEQFKEAAKYKAGYARAPLDAIGFARALTVSEFGLAVRMSCGDNFDKAVDNFLPPPKSIFAAHAIITKGYKSLDENQIRTLHNSWGDTWNDDGDIDIRYKEHKPYITEAWMITRIDPRKHFVHSFKRVIQKGEESTEVVALQRVLERYGYLKMPPKVKYGYYGELTAKAVMDFQLEYSVDLVREIKRLGGSIVGSKTIYKLNFMQGIA